MGKVLGLLISVSKEKKREEKIIDHSTKVTKTPLGGYVLILMEFPTLMGSVGGWVFVVDVTKGSVGKFIREGEREGEGENPLVRHIAILIS